MGVAAITIEPILGRSIDSVSAKACQIATMLELDVHFTFNGVKCIALPGGDPVVLASNWEAELRAKKAYPIATTHERPPSPTKEGQ